MTGWGSSVDAARLLCAAGGFALSAAPLSAQSRTPPPPTPAPPPPQPGELDPNAPLAPMPDLGVEWPDLNAKDSTLSTPAVAAQQPRTGTTEATGTIRYTVDVEGLSPALAWTDLLETFRKESALEADRKHPANAAQIGRRASADADLLTQLLRSQGYYDASVDASTARSGDRLTIILTADPGVQYHFASVDLPGLETAGPDAAKLRNSFAVKTG